MQVRTNARVQSVWMSIALARRSAGLGIPINVGMSIIVLVPNNGYCMMITARAAETAIWNLPTMTTTPANNMSLH
jgi:hypothetical protein